MSRSTALLLLARLVSAATTLVVLSLVARLRGDEALGLVGIGMALGAIGATASDLGSGSLLVREAARRPAEAGTLLGAALLTRVVSVPLTVGIVAAAAALVAPGQPVVIMLVAAGLIAQQTAEVTRAVFIARQRMGVVAMHVVVENVSWAACIALGLVAGWPLEAVFTLALAVLTASVLAGLWLDRSLAGAVPARPPSGELRRLARLARPFAAFSIVGIGYSRIDTFLIGVLASGAAVQAAGWYFAASRLIGAIEYLPDALSRAAYPALARDAAANPAAAAALLGRASAFLLVVGAGIPVVLAPAAPAIMGLLLTPEAAEAGGWILAGLAVAVPFRFLGHLHGIALTSADAQGRRVLAASLALVLVVLVDVALIPRIGIAAAVVAAVGAAALVMSLYALFARRQFGSVGLPPLLVAWVAASAGVAGGAALLASGTLGAGAAVLGAAAYALLVLAGPSRRALRSMAGDRLPARQPS